MAIRTQKTGYWRINPATGEREWIEGNYPPPQPKAEEEIVGEEIVELPEPVLPVVTPTLEERAAQIRTSEELYRLDQAWEEWSSYYSRTGQYPDTPPDLDLQPYYEQWLQVVKQWELEQQLPEQVRPAVPEVDVTELAGLYGLSAGMFVSAQQLADLALPPEERAIPWSIPFEQYLTWEQARWLGYDVPEGSVVRMTPMAEGEPSFYPMPLPEAREAEAERLKLDEELLERLRVAYPYLFEPSQYFGYHSIEEIPRLAVEQLQRRMVADYSGFVADLFKRVGQVEGETILRLLGVTEEFILLTLGAKEQEARVNTLITDVFPDFDNLEDFGKLIETDWDLFVETIQTDGSSPEKRALLEFMGYDVQTINNFFTVLRTTLPVDGVDQPLVIDLLKKKAYDQEGNWIGIYNWATQEFTSLPDEDWVKDVWDAFVFGGQHLYHQSQQFVVSSLPNFLFRDMGDLERRIYGDEWVDAVNAGNQMIRDEFRIVYNLNQSKFEKWLAEHPELAPPEWSRQDIKTRLFQDPLRTILYESASTAPFMIAVMGTTVAVAALTGNPALGLAAGAAMATPPQAQDAYDALLAAGATEAQAGQLSLPIGLVMSAIEVVGDMPYLRQVFPTVFKLFSKGITREVAKRTITSMAKKGITTFTMVEITETLEEIFQDAVLNAGIKTFNENQDIFEGWTETALRTLAATVPFAFLGGAVSLRRVSPSQTRGLTESEMTAKGWVQDGRGNWYETLDEILRGEEGFVRIPGEPEELGRAQRDRLAFLSEDLARIKKGIEEGTIPKAVGNKQIEDLNMEVANLEKQLAGIPRAEPGMPEAGLQPSLLPGEIAAREVRPRGKGEIVQISMEDQLKLEQARRAAEEAPPEVRGAYESQAEIEGLKVTIQADPVATARFRLGGKNVGLDAFISIKEQTFPEFFTVKQAEALFPGHEFINLTPEGKVRRDAALDDLSKRFNMTPDEIADRVMAIRKEKNRIKELESKIRTQMTEKPLTPRTELTTRQVRENWETIGQPKPTLKQAEALAGFFGEYVLSENALTAYELQRELWRRTMAERSQDFKARMQELIVSEGVSVEEAFNQATKDTLAGKLPIVTIDYFDRMAADLRASLFILVYHNKTLQKYPLEMAATITALTNAIGTIEQPARAIPRKRGPGSVLFPEGGSAWDRLNLVFGKQPKVLKSIDKMASEGKKLKDVVDGVFHETGREPIPIDQKTADYLRKLQDIPQGYKTLLEPEFNYPIVSDLRTPADLEFAKSEVELGRQLAEGKITFEEFELKRMEARDKAYPIQPITKFEAPIEKAIKEIPLWPVPVRENVIRALKEIGMLPIDIGNFLRANKASIDFSFWRQQAPLIVRHPITFVQANVEAWKAIWSQKSAEASWQRITRDPLFQIYEFAAEEGGDFLRPLIMPKGTAQYKGTEEFGFARGVARLLPRFTMWLPHIKISARAFEIGTNVHNWLIFKNYYNAMLSLSEQYASGKKTLKAGQVFDIQKEMVDFAKSLANFTARGSLGRYQIAAPALSAMFFAPRMALGRLLSVKDLLNANPRVRAEAWQNAASFVGTFGGIILLGAAAGWWEVERDPLNAEYMSIRIGNVRVDPWGGFRQFLVFFARAITKTGVSSVTGAQYDVDPLGLVQTFIRGKAAPLASLLLDFWRGKNFIGEEVDVANKKQWAERIAPFSVWDIYEAYMEDPTTALQIAIPAIVGAGVQTYTGDWVENWAKLGLPKYSDNLAYGIPEPYYDTQDFWADTAGQFKDVDPATLTKAKGFPEYIRAIAEARIIKENLDKLPKETLSSMNADPIAGTTFAHYYQMWRDREKIVASGDEEALKEFDADERTRNAYKGNFSQRQFALLNEYWAITDKEEQAEFLEEHKEEIGINPRQDWLRSHPSENAQLAIWGQAKIFSLEAYNEFKSLMKSLDIPDNAIPELTLPPETSIETHFAYLEMVSEGTHGSWEAQLLLLEDAEAAEKAGVQSYVEWRTEGGNPLKLSDAPIESLRLKTGDKYREIYYAIENNKDEEWDDYITDDTLRGEKIEELRHTKVDGELEFRDIEDITEALEKGADRDMANLWADRGRQADEFGGSSNMVKKWFLDNPKVYDWAVEQGLIKDTRDDWNETIIRLKAGFQEQFDKYEGYSEIDSEHYIEDEEERKISRDLLLGDEDFRVAYLKNEAYKQGYSESVWDAFVEFSGLPTWGGWRDRFLVDPTNNVFRNEYYSDEVGEGHIKVDIRDVKPLGRDVIEQEYRDKYEVWHDTLETTQDVEAYRRVEAYDRGLPVGHHDSYVSYFELIGRPEEQKDIVKDMWFEDDWFIMENMPFYNAMLEAEIWKEDDRRDFRLVPTREVWKKYKHYLSIASSRARKSYRKWNLDLDAWLVLRFGYTPIEEQMEEKVSEEARTIEEMILALWE